MRKSLISLLVFVFAFLTLSVSTVSAKVITDQKGTVSVAKTEIINDDLFIGAQAAEINGTVNGDVFIGAQTVKVTGVINGNLHVGARSLDLSGFVKGNVYAGGQNIQLTGSNIGGSLLVGGATVNIDKDSVIGGSILAGAGTLSLDAQVKRSVYAGTGNLTIGSDVRIGKDLYYAANDNRGRVDISTGAKIVGNTYKHEVKMATGSANMTAVSKAAPAIFSGIKFGASLISFLGALIVGLIFIKRFGTHASKVSGFASKSFWKSLGMGFLITIAFIPGIIILLLTVVGIPLAGLAILILILFIYFTRIVIGLALGTWLYQRLKIKASAFWAFALGLLVIYILKMVPVVGAVAGAVVLWSGLGALTLHVLSEKA